VDPFAATCIAGAIAGAVLAPIVAPVVLGVVGFGAAGPVAGKFKVNDGGFVVLGLGPPHAETGLMWTTATLGSIAAGIQAGIGNVAEGSLVAVIGAAIGAAAAPR
jgi:hypothetical protein